jgi:hypothetical protein
MNIKIDEFKKNHLPSQKKSKLMPFFEDIKSLKESGYSLDKICEYLQLNDVSVSRSGLHQYIKRREKIGHDQKNQQDSTDEKIGHDQKSQQDSTDKKIGHDQDQDIKSASQKISMLKVPVPKKFEHDSQIDPELLK